MLLHVNNAAWRGVYMKKRRRERRKRSGEPFTVYFSKELAGNLQVVSRQRHVSKAALVRFAVDQLLNQLRNGQMELPLGL
jgi:hypothetical protein